MNIYTQWPKALIVICILAGCGFNNKKLLRRKLYFTKECPVTYKKQTALPDPTITIWIHGARPFAANKYNLGLKSPTLFDPQDYVAQTVNSLINADPINFPLEHFYIYSWSGILDFSERQRASAILYTELEKLIAHYKQVSGSVPKIRVIAHSHGGNVALNLATHENTNFIIDELILLAVPVQAKTDTLVHSPLFKRIFSLYSTIDIPQIIDPQLFYRESGTYLLFSGQRFRPASNLMQVKIKINGSACQHLQFNDPATLKLFPQILNELISWMDTIPQETLLAENTRFMLSIYTNGRKPPRSKRYYNPQDPCEHKELPYTVA